MLKILADGVDRDDLAGMLDELVVEGARRMLAAALEAEVAESVDRHRELVDEAGHRLVVRNGSAPERTLVTAAGGLTIRAPRVHDRREGRRFSSYILPKYARRSPNESPWESWRLSALEARMRVMSRETTPGKPTTRRYSGSTR